MQNNTLTQIESDGNISSIIQQKNCR